MKTALVLVSFLLLNSCTTVEKSEPLSDSEIILQSLSTSSEFRDTAILLCIDKDCITVDRRRFDHVNSKHRVSDENIGKD
jgi:hypothetical protein